MRVLKGFEAIEVAEECDILLYDAEYKNEIPGTQARDFVHMGRNADAFVIQDWPDTEAEAEQIVMNEFHNYLREKRKPEARIFDISNRISGGLPIHLQAAELAAERLVAQGKLEVAETHDDHQVFRLPQTMGFGDPFFEALYDVMCEECAELNLDGTFHEACLFNLIDFMKRHDFQFGDIIELHNQSHPATHAKQSRGMEWLAKTASGAKLKWRNVLRPIFTRDEDFDEDANGDESGLHQPVEDTRHSAAYPATSANQLNQGQPADPQWAATNSVRPTGYVDYQQNEEQTRVKITKYDLLQYLSSVEIVEENGEFDRLQQEHEELLKQVKLKEREVQEIEKQRAAYEQHCSEMQRDVDILIEAMQIAKRREPKPVHVVDAAYGSPVHGE